MPFNPDGSYARVHDFTDDKAALVPVTASRMDSEVDAIASSLTDLKQNKQAKAALLTALAALVTSANKFPYFTALDQIAQADLTAYARSVLAAADAAAAKVLLALVKADVGLGSVDNTSDANKPVSSAQQAALDAKLAVAGGSLNGEVVQTAVNHVSEYAIGWRGAPQTEVNAARTLSLLDSGKSLWHNEATARAWTIPPNSAVPLPLGTVIIIDNTGNSSAAGIITLTQGAGVTLRRGDGVTASPTGNRTVAAGAVAAIRKTKTDEWVITGVFS